MAGEFEQQAGRLQPPPEIVKRTRRQFVTGLFLAGAGLAELTVVGIDKKINSRQRAEQQVRAYREVKARGTPAEPDQQAVANAQQLRDKLKNKDPLSPSAPQLEVAKQQATQTLG